MWWNCGCGDVLKLRAALGMSVGCSGCDLIVSLVAVDVRVMVRVSAVGSLKVATANVFICGWGGDGRRRIEENRSCEMLMRKQR